LTTSIEEKTGLKGPFELKHGEQGYAQSIHGKNSWSLKRLGLFDAVTVIFSPRTLTDEEESAIIEAEKEKERAQKRALEHAEERAKDQEEERKKEEEEKQRERTDSESAAKRKISETASAPTSPEKPDDKKSPLSLSVPTSPTSPPGAKKGFLASLFARSPKSKTSESETVPEELRKQWYEFTSPKSTLSWVLLGYSDTKSKKVVLLSTGKSGLGELKKAMDETAVQFGAFRVVATDEHSTRPKFVGFTLVGSKLSPSQRVQAMHVKEVQRDLITGLATQLHVEHASELVEDKISAQLIGVERGALSYDFGGGSVYEVPGVQRK